ncbi:2-hydroxyacid dehydrogenase [Inhella proteolytica]|uniref:Glyoxylate/hydroxypyruvate reductase A n=1 Tax=Inhella proteolytica TaxID=2795029 RepID=A0A931IZR0_9BURK|nr:glyoxylate/hydroxypyruvate reductase A [Inhella proteolytica]MBH9576804.1 glyoxylate/hydroxypyruvate reductase A [Inhella proteolytica]
MRVTVCLPEGTSRWAAELQQALGPGATVEPWQAGQAPADYAVLWKPPAEFLSAQPRLKALFAAGAGVDALRTLPLPAGVPLVRLEDAGMGVQMAEYVLHALLRWYRGFDRYANQAAAAAWWPQPPQRKADWTVGLLGYGQLAQPVAQALRGLGFPVQAWARSARAADLPLFAGPEGLAPFLRSSRVLVALLPLTEATRGLINTELLNQLPDQAYLINVARGGLVVEADLLAALDSGHLAGAALDVCTPEPAPPNHPFWRHPRIQLTPHIAAATLREEAVAQIAAKIRALEAGQPISGVVGADGY